MKEKFDHNNSYEITINGFQDRKINDIRNVIFGLCYGKPSSVLRWEGGKRSFSQINFNLCSNERSTFCGFKRCSTTSQLNLDLFLRFFKVRS